jgi:hypothetical protein
MQSNIIVYYVMRSKNEVLCAAAKAHKTIFAPNNIYYFILKRNKTIKRTPLERNFSDLNY